MIQDTIQLIAGVDEAGRGPLAGPVIASAVILNPRSPIIGLMDSKKLTASKREALAAQIRCQAIAWTIGAASVEEIDKYNILNATLLAMKRALELLYTVPDQILIDGIHSPRLPIPTQTLVQGDQQVPSISAASILAKVTRDHLMQVLHDKHPEYGFAQHKGYGTRQHLAALKKYGYTQHHRHSFAPVRACSIRRD
jgi:ribonuclease HII